MKQLGAQASAEDSEVEDIERQPGVEVKSWFPEADTEEDSDAGEETAHVTPRRLGRAERLSLR